MKKIFLCFVFIFAFFISSQSVLADTAKELVEQGFNLEKQSIYGEAVKIYTKAIQSDEKYADAYFRRGKALFSLKPSNCMEAIDDFTKVIELVPANAAAYYERGLLNAYVINNEQAKSDMETAARLGNKGAQKWLGLREKEGEIKGEQVRADMELAAGLDYEVEPLIHFDFNSYYIKPSYYALLDKIGMTLKEGQPEVAIILAGYADSTGSEAYNYRLSLRRANAVRKYLLERHGIAPPRIIVQAYGESKPVASNDTKEGRSLNRRVLLTGMD